MKRIISLAIFACALLAAGCSKPADTPSAAVPSGNVVFTANINHFAVKSTDTAFDDGDAIGIFAGAPIDKDNVQATVSGSSVTVDSANPIKWMADQTASTAFVSYYPYATVDDATAYPFTVAADQTNGVSSSDLMVANTTAEPETTVNLVFKHVLSKIIIRIDNQLDKAVSEVQFTNVADNAQFNLNDAGAEVDGTVGDPIPAVTAQNITTADDEQAIYQLIIVPQSAQPQIKVTLEDGTAYVYSLASAFSFATGKRYTAEIAVTDDTPTEGEEVSFTLEVTDWEDAEENPVFGTQELSPENKWSVIGKLMGSDWDKDFIMTDNKDNTWSIDITYATGDAFKFRYNGEWTYQYGMWNNVDPADVKTIESAWIAATTDTNPTYGLADGSAEQPNCNIALPEPGKYTLKVCTYGDNAGQFFVTKK